MLTLYSYPALFGVADNNGYGLKLFAFLKLTGVPFAQRHTFHASQAPRQQLPYVVDDGETIGDSDTIIAHLIRRHGLTIDAGLANIYFYSIETPLKKFVTSHTNLVRHCTAVHRLVASSRPPSPGEDSRAEQSA